MPFPFGFGSRSTGTTRTPDPEGGGGSGAGDNNLINVKYRKGIQCIAFVDFVSLTVL